MAIVTSELSLVTRLPEVSSTATTKGPTLVPADPWPGWAIKATWLGAPGATLKLSDVAPARLPSAAVRV